MSNWNPESQALYNSCFDKQHYDLYLKAKELPDDVHVKFDLKTPEGEYCATVEMTVGKLKEIGKEIEENRKPKE